MGEEERERQLGRRERVTSERVGKRREKIPEKHGKVKFNTHDLNAIKLSDLIIRGPKIDQTKFILKRYLSPINNNM